MRRSFALFLMVALLVGLQMQPALADIDDDTLYLFWGDGCPHCEAEREFLDDLSSAYPDLEIELHEVWYDLDGRAEFVAAMAAIGEEPQAVPTTLFAGRVWVGFDDSVSRQIEGLVDQRFGSTDVDPTPVEGRTVDIPLIGSVDVENTALLPATFVIALVDGFNPCSLWALSILLALVLRSGSRKRVLLVGGTFLLVTTLLYGLFIGGLYGALSYAANATWIRVVMAVIALVFGLINLKDFLWFKRGVSLSIPEKAKPKLYARMRSVSDTERPLTGVLFGTAGLAVGVSLLETPCTAGYPLLWSNLLAEQGVGLSTALALFGVYMLVFLVDELAVFGTAVIAMRAAKLDERAGRTLKLFSGVLMVALAVTLIAFPDAMNSLTGAVAVFGAAVVIAALMWVIARLLRRGETQADEREPALVTKR